LDTDAYDFLCILAHAVQAQVVGARLYYYVCEWLTKREWTSKWMRHVRITMHPS